MSVRTGAEILAIEVSIDGKKFVFCSVYRVGNLDKPNHDSIMSTIKTFYKIRNPRKIFIVGDFNLKSISWPRSEDMGNGNGTDRLFIDSFNGFGLDQCISGSTHNKGRTLDLMLTNSKNFVTEIIVSPDSYLCKSDHYLLTFEVRSNVKRNKAPIRKILNFKKANWEALNNELSNIHWDAILDCMEPELAWLAFKRTLFYLVDRYIPSISIKSDFTSPWFDAECFEAYRNKDRAHKKFKNYSRIEGNTQNIIQSEINFKYKRQLFKNMCNKKMRDNLYNEDDPGLITKKFWSHVKSNSKSSRLPETMHLDDTFRNKPYEKAELFNNYFYEQFSGPSNYNTDINFSNDQVFDIDFNRNRVHKHLSNINSHALQEVPDLATALKCLLPALGGTYRSVHPLSLFFFLFFSPGWSGRWDFFPSLAGTFTLVETVTAATPFSFFPKPQQLTERVRTLATGCCTLQTPVANCHLQFPESFASLAPPSPF